MATGSQAAGKQRLQEANYRIRQGGQPGVQRCSGCRHVDPEQTAKQHGRYCTLHRAAVLTHGVCDAWGNPKPAAADQAAQAAFRDEALLACLDALLTMIPGYCKAAGVEQCTEARHDEAIHRAVIALHGPDAGRWPPLLVQVVAGRLSE